MSDKLPTDRLRELQKAITPGPFSALIHEGAASATVYAVNCDATNRFTAQIQQGYVRQTRHEHERTPMEEIHAVAHLFAAAPDLIAELLRLRTALEEAANELDAYYEREYAGDHPYSVRKLAQAKATNPARAALSPVETDPQSG